MIIDCPNIPRTHNAIGLDYTTKPLYFSEKVFRRKQPAAVRTRVLHLELTIRFGGQDDDFDIPKYKSFLQYILQILRRMSVFYPKLQSLNVCLRFGLHVPDIGYNKCNGEDLPYYFELG